MQGRARIGQIPGFALAHGFASSDDLRRVIVLLALSAAGAAAARFASDRMAGADIRLPSAAWWTLAAAIPVALTVESPLWTAATALFAFAAIGRRLVLGVDRADRLAVPWAIANTLIAWSFLGRDVVGQRVPLVPFLVSSCVYFWAIAPLGKAQVGSCAVSLVFLPVSFWRTRPPGVDLVAGACVVSVPLVAARMGHAGAALRRRAMGISLVLSFMIFASAVCLRRAPQSDVFEDGHALLPASEYLAGRLPYRDIIPGHGLVSDGLLQAAELRLFGADYRGLSRGNRVVGAAFWPLFFLVGFSASGDLATGFWTMALSFAFFPQYMFFRVIPSLTLLSAAGFARRQRRRGPWLITGALIPLALLTAVEFAFYGVLAAGAALVVSKGRRIRNGANLAAGTLLTSLPIFGILAALGLVRRFLQTTFLFLPRLAPAYALGFPALPPGMPPPIFPDFLLALGDPRSIYFWALFASIIAIGAALPNLRYLPKRLRAVFPLLIWFFAATLSVLERWHTGYAMFVVPAAIVLVTRWLAGSTSSARRMVAAALIGWAVVVCRPMQLAGSVEAVLSNPSPPTPVIFLSTPPRGRGAAYDPRSAARLTDAGVFIERLAPGETWFDFTSTPSLYFFFDRRCPVRYPEVAFYESPQAQREVIDALDRNPGVRAALIHFDPGSEAIDGISNRLRAPMVWSYVERNFHPAYASGDVAFWLRNEAPRK